MRGARPPPTHLRAPDPPHGFSRTHHGLRAHCVTRAVGTCARSVLSPSLKESRLFRQFERLAIMHRDAELLLILLFKTKHEMSWRALTFLLHYMWSTARRLPPTGLFVDQGKLGSKEPSALLDASVSLSANGGPGARHEACARARAGARADVAPVRTARRARARQLWPPPCVRLLRRAGATAVYNGVSLADEIQSFLLHYLFSRRQPLSATSAVLRACKHEIDENSESKHYMSAVFNRFQSLNAALLKQVALGGACSREPVPQTPPGTSLSRLLLSGDLRPATAVRALGVPGRRWGVCWATRTACRCCTACWTPRCCTPTTRPSTTPAPCRCGWFFPSPCRSRHTQYVCRASRPLRHCASATEVQRRGSMAGVLMSCCAALTHAGANACAPV